MEKKLTGKETLLYPVERINPQRRGALVELKCVWFGRGKKYLFICGCLIAIQHRNNYFDSKSLTTNLETRKPERRGEMYT